MHTSPTPAAHARLRPLPLRAIRLTAGFWKARQDTNRATSLKHGYQMLEDSDTFNNLRLAGGHGTGTFAGYVFQDSDVYKWLEAAALAQRDDADPELGLLVERVIGILADAQHPDGYLNSHFTVAKPGQRWTDLEWAHELYCAGHLIEAALAHQRATGQTQLFHIALKFADHIAATFGPGQRSGRCGHPEIELALVELFRETGERRYLTLAQYFIDQRGTGGVQGLQHLGPGYMQERVPVREATGVEGHAVRQLYLNAGATDLYLETGETALLEAMHRQWHDLTAHKMYLIGGFGARAYGEAFGNPYELPSREAYCETCAAIAAIMWNWRMLLATGEARFADLLERSLYNGFLSGVSLDGRGFFYENPLKHDGGYERQPWFPCACCPPNVMRLMELVGHYLATTDPRGVQIHQYAGAEINAGGRALRVETRYPWAGQVKITITETDGAAWRLALRIPEWCVEAVVKSDEVKSEREGGYAVLERAWRVGDEVTLDLPLPARLTRAHPYIDELRGGVALERGPLVYCVEGADHASVNLSEVRLRMEADVRAVWREDLLKGVMTLETEGTLADLSAWAGKLYGPATNAGETSDRPVTVTAIPYFAWANRGGNPMRVWLPLDEASTISPESVH